MWQTGAASTFFPICTFLGHHHNVYSGNTHYWSGKKLYISICTSTCSTVWVLRLFPSWCSFPGLTDFPLSSKDVVYSSFKKVRSASSNKCPQREAHQSNFWEMKRLNIGRIVTAVFHRIIGWFGLEETLKSSNSKLPAMGRGVMEITTEVLSAFFYGGGSASKK